MSKRQVLMLLGVWVMAIFHLGFPEWLDKILLLISGASIVGIAYRTGAGSATGDVSSSRDVPYVDHRREVKQPDRSGTFT